MLIQILNNCQGPHYIQLPHSNGGKVIGEIVTLQPGLNLVEAKKFAEMKKNKGVERLLKTKIAPSVAAEADRRTFGKPMLEVLSKELDEAKPFHTADGKEMAHEEACSIIALTQDTDVLDSWRQALKPSNQLVKVINERIKEVTSGIEAGSTLELKTA